ncbi:hypothetical protein [Rhodococcus sp. HNM0569]|uniref:hypothetical protein n=1 Tax=Rhodococcus sp. HNM0569 TaxID=2716340 RepID=UPI00146D121A|nr:hypothetical protein [Rhodococcus sp. HNM0569]NLU83555.1 hypothetical protein [Rhodococcus sp. HNM0569]
MQWIALGIAGWLVLSVAVAVVLGRVIRARDEHERPRPLDDPAPRDAFGDTDRRRDDGH